MRIESDGWLSEVLGVASWKLLGLDAATPCAAIQAGLRDRARNDAAFFQAKIATRDVIAVNNARRAGFAVIDVNVTLDWDNCAGFGQEGGAGVIVESVTADDVAAIEAIAGRCFTFSRFHLDPAIGLERAHEVKRQWARNACNGRAKAVYVARRGGAVCGFLAVLVNEQAERTDAVIDLVGVDGSHQGQGAGRALSSFFIERWRDRADRLRVGTQISNIRALRLYESIGFRVTETTYVLHAHVRNGALAA